MLVATEDTRVHYVACADCGARWAGPYPTRSAASIEADGMNTDVYWRRAAPMRLGMGPCCGTEDHVEQQEDRMRVALVAVAALLWLIPVALRGLLRMFRHPVAVLGVLLALMVGARALAHAGPAVAVILLVGAATVPVGAVIALMLSAVRHNRPAPVRRFDMPDRSPDQERSQADRMHDLNRRG